jgi:rod shape-determining protein MreC
MKNLILFILGNKFFLVFLMLEAIAVLLIVQNNSFQRSKFIYASNGFTSSINQKVENVVSYFNLKSENEKLTQEIIMLKENLQSNFFVKSDSVFEINDTVYMKKYNFLSAKIIQNNFHNTNNFLIINKGSSDGISNGMGVITQNGIIGIVKDVSKNFSSVISILHSKSAVSVKLKNTDYLGTLKWDGQDFNIAKITLIPSHIELNVGDTIMSSGNSSIFPENIPIGTIKEFQLPLGESFYDVKMRFFTEYNKVKNVQVVSNIYKEELNQLIETQD